MADPDLRPQRVESQSADVKQIVYDFHIEIVVKAAALDEKRLQQLIDERDERLAAALRSRAK